MEVLDESFFKLWQDSALNWARRLLRRDKHLEPVVLALATPGLVQPGAEKMLKPLDQVLDIRSSDNMLVIIPGWLRYDMGREYILAIAPPEVRSMLEAMVAMGPENADERFCKMFCEFFKLHEKDLYVRMLKWLLNTRLRAHAYVKMDECWVMERPFKTEQEMHEFMRTTDLSTHPDATEAICSMMETKQFQRQVRLPFRRKHPRKGRIVWFGIPDDRAPSSFHGRFANLLEKDSAVPSEARP